MVRIALAGLGDIGLSAHLPALLRRPDVRIAALVDPDADRRERAVQLFGDTDVRLCADLDDVLGTDIDGVVIATPPWVTPALCVHALRAGHHVLAEKPLAPSVADAQVYSELSDDEAGRLQVGLTYRHDPAVHQLREWVVDRRLGFPLLVRAHVYDEALDPADPEHADRIRRTLAHGLPVIHEGAHVFDWLSVILGAEPGDVEDAWALQTDDDAPAPNIVGARLRYPGGIVALAEFGWLTESLPRGEISILGPAGHAVLDATSFALSLSTRTGTQTASFPGERMTRCFDRQLDRFLQLVTGQRAGPEPDLADGLAVLRLAERISRQATEELVQQ